MATTRIIPLHAGKGRTVGKAISDIIDYVKNPEKTDHGRLITSYQCDSRVADAQFLLDKQTYAARTGRVRGADDVIAYHLRQSFVPGEITPEEANRLGVELARRFTKGKHAFVVCTHIDKSHTHNHIIWNSTTLECDRKFRNFWGSTRAVHRLSDTICIENGYSIVEAPKRRGQSYNKWLGDAAKPSHKEQLRQAIDRALAQKPASLEALLRLLEQNRLPVSAAAVERMTETLRTGGKLDLAARSWFFVAQGDLAAVIYAPPGGIPPVPVPLPQEETPVILPFSPQKSLKLTLCNKIVANTSEKFNISLLKYAIDCDRI